MSTSIYNSTSSKQHSPPIVKPPSKSGSLSAAAASATVSASNATVTLSASLVKEYLAARGLERTLEAFKLEHLQFLKKAPPVSSRQELAEQLGITKLVRQNKAHDQPLKTQLEIIVRHLSTHSQKDSNPALKTSETLRPGGTAESVKSRPTTAQSTASKTPSTIKDEFTGPTSVAFQTPLGGFNAANPRAVFSNTAQNVSASRPQTATASNMKGNTSESSNGILEGFTRSSKEKSGFFKSSTSNNDIQVLDDFDEDEYSISSDVGIPLLPSKFGGPNHNTQGSLITTQKAMLLRKAVFPGTLTGGEESRARMTFSEEWKGKGFCFNAVQQDLAYGLVQVKGGPCGLLAAVQAYVLKYLLFVDSAHSLRNGKLRPGKHECQAALVEAIAEILWQAGGTRHRKAVVATYNPNLRANPGGNLQREKYTPDGITENMELFEFFGTTELKTVARIPSLQEDFDELDSSMIGRHGYCTQEMVNLILVGQAISNVHDGDCRLGEGSDVKVLKGIKRTSQFGYLSLFEHYGSMKVGEYMKTPHLPIFIICSESHFTVLFSVERDLLSKVDKAVPVKSRSKAPPIYEPFLLYYYDGLANQDCEISLEVERTDSRRHEHGSSDALVPPLEQVIRTKWADAVSVKWIGTDPLL
ncbi:hypothetical protein CcCBS67573_g07322 [Chytriomyces confervae]|uniref:Probable ubiquitin carboxyl-terminal hydrolase MINDY-4 n=1 Tax=Chytriomyces confervae TaxID=246404 RepID=A0A507EXB6_9FUNG|nr:hypothetical protein CcCBS67573_g07322 [Chytriomyces confervae]